jgi:hypothetical protein
MNILDMAELETLKKEERSYLPYHGKIKKGRLVY